MVGGSKSTKKTKTRVAMKPLPQRYKTFQPESDQDITDKLGWWVSRKHNGMFGRWIGPRNCLVTKSGRVLHQFPDSEKQTLPKDLVIDGEIYADDMNDTRKAVLGTDWNADKVHFMPFDVVDPSRTFEERYSTLSCLAMPIILSKPLSSRKEWDRWLDKVKKHKWEGLVLRDPEGKYITDGKRHGSTLKWKPWHRLKAQVVGMTTKKVNIILSLKGGRFPEFRCTVSKRLAQEHMLRIGSTVHVQWSGEDPHTHKPELVRWLKK